MHPTFDAGEYVVEATANMVGEYDEAISGIDTKTSDMIAINNDWDYTITVENFEPTFTSLYASNEMVYVTGDSVTVATNAFDVEGDKLTYAMFDGWKFYLVKTTLMKMEFVHLLRHNPMMPSLEIRVEVSRWINSVDSSIVIDSCRTEYFRSYRSCRWFQCSLRSYSKNKWT